MADANDYPRSELLVETAWLQEHEGDANIRLVDCAPPDAYNRAHIPGAVGLPGVAPQVKDPDDDVHVMPPRPFSELMARLGIDNGTTVVSYDSNNSLWAARFWWVLRYHGHHNAKVLNGGWHKWVHEARPISISPSRVTASGFVAKPDSSVLCTLDQLQHRVGSGAGGILDVRSNEEYTGGNSRGNRRVGRVPGAAHIEWLDFITDDERHIFKPASQVEAMLTAAGISPEQEVITYCQAGIRAAHVHFVLTLLGYEHVRNYDGSMREWANRDDTPLDLPA